MGKFGVRKSKGDIIFTAFNNKIASMIDPAEIYAPYINMNTLHVVLGQAVSQLVEDCSRHCVTRSEVPSSMLFRVLGNLQVTFILSKFRSYTVHVASNKNKY